MRRHRTAWIIASLALLALLAASAALTPQVAVSSQIYYLPLEEVLTPTSVVVEALVKSRTLTRTPDDVSVVYDIEVLSIWQGALPHKPTKGFAHEIIPVVRNPKTGEIEMTFSPIFPGSGLELGLMPDQRYILITNTAPSAPASPFGIQRAEPLDNAEAVKALIERFKTTPPPTP